MFEVDTAANEGGHYHRKKEKSETDSFGQRSLS